MAVHRHLPVRAARLLVGPIALAAFFADWVDGSGVLAGHRFSGFEIVALTGRLQLLDLTALEAAGLQVARLAVLGVAIAAAWQVILAVAPRRGAVYAASGWYLAAAAAAVTALAVYQGGPMVPLGTLLLLASALCFIIGSRKQRAFVRRAGAP